MHLASDFKSLLTAHFKQAGVRHGSCCNELHCQTARNITCILNGNSQVGTLCCHFKFFGRQFKHIIGKFNQAVPHRHFNAVIGHSFKFRVGAHQTDRDFALLARGVNMDKFGLVVDFAGDAFIGHIQCASLAAREVTVQLFPHSLDVILDPAVNYNVALRGCAGFVVLAVLIVALFCINVKVGTCQTVRSVQPERPAVADCDFLAAAVITDKQEVSHCITPLFWKSNRGLQCGSPAPSLRGIPGQGLSH